MSNESSALLADKATAEEVLAYLRAHPTFLRDHPELLQTLTPPGRELGENVADFQHFQLKALQQNASSLQGKYESLVDFCRDNLSVQGQVHAAALLLIRAESLEQLLEAVTVDLTGLFDLDVVRLCIESDTAEFYTPYYGEGNYSGLVFVDSGLCEAIFGGRQALLVADTDARDIPGFSQIFAECDRMILSCALLKLRLERSEKEALLAFGVRYRQRFHGAQAADLLTFLADILAVQLDKYLGDIAETPDVA